MSGRYTYVVIATDAQYNAMEAVRCCCQYLGIDEAQGVSLVYGAEVIPPHFNVRDWPGLRPPGVVSEYELVVGTPSVDAVPF
eukprot:2364472-Amphidinium_carterae.1